MTQETSAVEPSIPAGMVEVTWGEFYELLKRDQRDIMPKNTRREFTTWETPNRYAWGWSLPGWAYPGGRQVYAVSIALAKHQTAIEI